MKFLARRLAACAAIASFACLLTVSAAHEHKDHKVEGIRLNHDDKQHVRHHHHRNQQHHHHQGHQGHRKHKKKQKKPIKPNPPAVFETRELDLICDHFLVDTLVCKTKVEHPTGALTALNNGGNVIKEFIKMDSPCSSEPPEVCSAAAATAGAGKNNCRHGHQVHKRGRHVRHQKTHKIKGHNGRKHHANRKHHKHNKNCKHRKHHKHPKHGGHSKHHGKHHHHQKPKHPYEGLCVSVGKFCGSKLFGCNFNFTTLYTCSAVGEKPVVTLPNAPACTGTPFTRPCECSASSKPTCGSQLPAECHADPAAIYYCPGGPGSKYEIQKICDPGSQCRRPVAGEPICGFASCKCIGTEQVCAQQFPDDCNLEKNTVYQCTTDGQPEAVKSCDGDKTCISVDAEATCTSTDCKCPTDGTVCGEAFPLSCNLPGTILFDCKKGQDPVLSQNCLPGRCTTKLSAVAAASLIFEASAVNDKCADSCKCISAGDVRLASFHPYLNGVCGNVADHFTAIGSCY
ncbi:hypothetical protein BGX31_004138 [Mortierella sp. GBA43]|nr:hypothetical protein BGX31_004138 [Mortierella sp. GBA43]